MLHAAAVALVLHPASWRWAVAAVLANQLVLFAAVFFVRGRLLGPNLDQLPPSRYVSWTRRGLDGVSRDAQRVLARLTAGLAASDVLLLHDNSPLSLEVLATLLEHLNARGLKSVSLPTACSLSS